MLTLPLDYGRELELTGYGTKRGGKWHASTVRYVWRARKRYQAEGAA